MERTPLCDLAVKYGTDKTPFLNSPDWRTHGYTPYYHEILSGRKVKRLLEIGVAGGASLRMWRDYFPEAQIFGFDNDEKTFFTEERISCSYADQADKVSLLTALDKIGGCFDVIIEDGDHISAHQVLTANLLQWCLEPGGIYIMEDVCHPEEVTPFLTGKYSVHEFNLGLLSDDRIIVIHAR